MFTHPDRIGHPAHPWVQRAERTVRAEAEPATALALYYVCGLLELARGHDADALAAFRAAEGLAGHIAAPHYLVPQTRAMLMHALVRLGKLEQAGQVLAGLGDQDRDRGETRTAAAVPRQARHDPHAATATLAPVLDGSAPPAHPVPWQAGPASALLLEAIARDALADPAAAGRALERALDIAEPDRILLPFLLYRALGLLERHARDCARRAALVSEILSLLPAGHGEQERPGGVASPQARRNDPGESPPRLIDPLTKSETRVLRYLPTNLSAQEIANELYVSPNTVKTHMRTLYAKFGAHRRTEAVARARALGLLAPSARTSR